jgi:phosphate transporter
MKSSEDIFPAVRKHGLMVSLVVFAISMAMPSITPDNKAASRCLSLLLLIVCLWITEAIPYFSTALLVPPLVTFMGVLRDNTEARNPLPANLAAAFVLEHVFNHTTMLLLGGYTISSAFSRCQLELRLASWLQVMLGQHPRLFILAVMLLGLFLSMWISNHTAPILCSTIIMPIVRDLPTDSRFSKSLLLGLAFACNFGGMMTPISSLQNALAVSYLEQAGIIVSFGTWIAVAMPFSLICTFICWLLIIVVEKPDDVASIPVIVYERSSVIGKRNMTVMAISLLTILLFATSSLTSHIFGDIAIISLCFVALMFGSGMLSEVDFNSLSWHTLILIGGGNVLGKAVESSGLLTYLTLGITSSLPVTRPWLALLYILLFCGTIATFVSHTVASIILMPAIARIGLSMHMPEVVVIGSAFAVSAAMALPFSSFPNVNSLLILDDFQRPYLKVPDFIKTGLPMSLITILLIATIGASFINLIVVN